LAPQANALSS